MARHEKGKPPSATTAAGSGSTTLLDELKEVAVKLGFEVRQEKLLREVGYRVRSGSCRVRALRIILLDRGLPVSAQVDVLAGELSRERLEDVYLSPAARRLLDAPSVAGGAA